GAGGNGAGERPRQGAPLPRRGGRAGAVLHRRAARHEGGRRMTTIWNEDCIPGMAARMDPESVDLTVTSIPFADLFMYSGKNEDVGNCEAGTDFVASFFGLHMQFMVEQLFRVMKPGCNA